MGQGTGESAGEYYSGFAHEDLISNGIGVEFAEQWDCSVGGLASDALEKYLKSLGVGDAPLAGTPLFDDLPYDEEAWHERNRWYDPMLRALDYTIGVLVDPAGYFAANVEQNRNPSRNSGVSPTPYVSTAAAVGAAPLRNGRVAAAAAIAPLHNVRTVFDVGLAPLRRLFG